MPDQRQGNLRIPSALPATCRRFRGCLAALFVAAALGSTAAGAATLGVTMIPPIAFTQLLRDRIAEQAKARGFDVGFTYTPEGAGEQQIAQVKSFINGKVDALLVMPDDAAANATITRLAQEADIPLVYFNNGPREDWFSKRVAFVLPNDLVAGRL